MENLFQKLGFIIRAKAEYFYLIVRYGGANKIPRRIFIEKAEKHLKILKRALKDAKKNMPADLPQDLKKGFIDILGEEKYLEKKIALMKTEIRQDKEIKVALTKWNRSKNGRK